MNIETFLREDGSLNLSKLTKSPEGKEFLARAAEVYGEGRPAQLAYRVKHGVKVLPSCRGCNKPLTEKNFIDFKKGYRTFCSNSCSSRSPEKVAKFTEHLRSKEFKTRRREKIIERYGTHSMIDLNRDKAKITSLARYGVDNPLKSDYAKLRKVEKVIEKYGVDNVWKLPQVQEKIKQTLLERYGVDDPLKLVDWSKYAVTKPHQEIIDLISPYTKEIVINDRRTIEPYELDVYLPELKLAIEFNGLYWHTEEAGKHASYHLNKTLECEKLGIKLIQIFEDEWRFKREIVESRIKNQLGASKRIYARSCTVEMISAEEADRFLEDTHVQGKARSSIRLGLKQSGELKALMTFGKPRYNKNYDWELIRYSTERDLTVVGGASKLLAYFRKVYTGSIISYADRRWSDGNLYRKLGFSEISTTKPSYFYVGHKFTHRINRVAAQKHRLDAFLGELFDPTKSEAENMKAAGYFRIFDCGHYVFALSPK
jgi:hypothetical protein